MARLTSTGHPADHELLLAIDPAARPARRTGVDRHLNDCAPCRARVDRLQAWLQEMTAEYQRVSVRDDTSMAAQRARLARTLNAMPAPRRSWWLRASGWPSISYASIALPSLAVAAVAVAVIVIGLAAPWASWLGRRGDDARASFARELPAAGLTPGATAPVIVGDLCAGGMPSRVVSADVRLAVLRAYGMENAPADTYELDALITPELGGTTDARNLWPQRYASLVWHARVKDVLEERLAADVCAGRRDLLSAQRDLATDWIAAYRRYFQTDVPLQAHLGYRPDEPELVVAALGLPFDVSSVRITITERTDR